MTSSPQSGLFVSSVIDFTALIIILLDAYFGFRRGLSGETARFFVLVLGVVATALLLDPIGTMCFRYASPSIPEPGRYAFAFVATTVTASVIMLLVYRPVFNWLDLNAPKHRNKFGGLVAGLTRGFIGVTVVLIVLNLWPSPVVNRVVGQESVAGRAANKIVPIVKSRLSSHGWAAAESRAGDKGKSKNKGVLDIFRDEKRDRDSVTR